MIKRIMALIATVILLMTYVACEKDDDQTPAVVNITTEVSMEGKIVSLQMKEVDSNKPIEKFRLQLSENYNFSPMQVYDCEAKEKKFTLPNLQNGKTYYYRYVVSNGSDYMVLHDVNYFRTDLHCKLTLKTNQKGERFANCLSGAGNYSLGYSVRIQAYNVEDYTFVGWSDSVKSRDRMVTLDDDMELTALYEPSQCKLELSAEPEEGGKVYGTGNYLSGDTVTVVAKPAEGYRFVGWNDETLTDSFLLVIKENRSLTAKFERLQYQLALKATEGGIVSGDSLYYHGESATIKATAQPGYSFVGWSDGETNTERTITMVADVSLTAQFAKNTYSVKLSSSPSDGGTTEGAGIYEYGDKATIKAVAATGYSFVGWSDGNTQASRSEVIEESLILVAEFEANRYRLTLVASPTNGGTVAGGDSYVYGTKVTVEATPAKGYEFVKWSDGETSAKRTVKVEESTTLIAYFAVKKFTVSVAATPSAGGTVAGGGIYEYMTKAKLEATPSLGYTFVKWSDGETSRSRSLDVDSDLELKAVFAPIMYNVTAAVSPLEGGRVSGTGEYTYGQSALLTAIPAKGYRFVGWSDGSKQVTRTEIVTSDLSFLATFIENVYTLSLSATKGGEVAGSGNYKQGTEVEIVATPDAHYHFKSWSDGVEDSLRTIVIEEDLELEAEFEADKYKVTLSVTDSTYGTVTGTGTYEYGETAVIKAIPNAGYRFVSWSDGSTLSSRTIKVEENLSLEAEFEKISVKGTTYTVNGVTFKMVYVDGGTFTMGATSEQVSDAFYNESPAHLVTLSDYYMGETEVTQALWEAVMGTNPSYFRGQKNLPVESVSWDDCQTFVRKLNALTGAAFRLPTESEWEYAARGGSKSRGYKYSGGNTIDDVAWYDGNSYETHPVGTKFPNELGLYDMSGNVLEWCSDRYGSYSSSSSPNPTGPSSGSYRVDRGGGLHNSAWNCRVSYRGYDYPVNRSFRGLRLALSSHPEQEADKYNVNLSVNDSTYGTVEGSGIYEYGETVEIEAIPNEGYRFVSWRDGSTLSSRTINVKENLSLEAEFEKIGSSTDGTTYTVNGVTFKMVYVAGGTFTMGAMSEQGGDPGPEEWPTHRVTLSDYYMGETEVTQALWKAVMGTNPSRFSGPNLPVEKVSWDDCQTFVRKLNALTGGDFRLPTEAEWEYAARGGGKNRGYRYSGGNTFDDVAWYYGNSSSKTQPVGKKRPNELGLYDMSGNVWEWCSDWYGSYSSSASTNPTGPLAGSYRVFRGGSWNSDAWYCRVSCRSAYYPDYRIDDIGLRLALSSHPEQEADKYNVTLSVNDSTYGTVEGTGIYEYGETVEIEAIPNEGYRFVSWSDGSTLPSRTINVKENLSLVAEFEDINRTYTVNGVTFKMVNVAGGTFTMGATYEQGSDAYDYEMPTHRVTLSDYYIGETEVTQALWAAVMGAKPSYFSGSNLPVEEVSWNDCQTFVRKLNALTGTDFRLPTEAEWEYAARGGSKSQGYKYSGGNTIDDVAWYDGNSSGMTHPVGTKLPNELGLYDMSGNVWEWCSDRSGSYSSTSSTNPTGPSSGSFRVYRGGSWNYYARSCRVSRRLDDFPDYGSYIIGLRLALSSHPEQEADKYNVTLSVNDSTYGTVEGTGIYEYGETVEIEAIPNEGYRFVSWSDGSTLSSRTINVKENLSFVAEFEEINRTITYTVNGVTFKMVYVKGGTFTMGATSEQGSDAYDMEKPTHSVTLSDYYMGETEVTQALWEAVMGTNPSYSKGSNLPVEEVSWNDCQTFVRKLNALTGTDFRLPTEAEWEYAARGGSKSQGYKYSGGNTIDDVAWYDGNSSGMTHPVGTKLPNELGLYDMSGNVWEWCSDWYGNYSSTSSTNPTGPSSGSIRVYRGGSWYIIARYCRVSYRLDHYPLNWRSGIGLRLALSSHP